MRASKIWIIIATSLLIVGAVIFTVVMSSVGWNFKSISTVKYETNSYTVSEQYSNIAITTGTADIEFAVSTDGKTNVVCYEDEKIRHKVSVNDGTLTVEPEDKRGWLDHIGIDFNKSRITVYLPSSECGSLTVKSDTGSVQIPKDTVFSSVDVSVSTGDVKCYCDVTGSMKIAASTGHITLGGVCAGELRLSVSTGDVKMDDVRCARDTSITVSTGRTNINGLDCKSFTTVGGTGDLTMCDVIASEKIDIKRTTGKVKFEGCDAPDITVKTGTGDVIGTFLSSKIFTAKTSTGEVSLPDERTGGSCRITTSTGDIIISVRG